jgi:DNA polymerase-3 subunit alpha
VCCGRDPDFPYVLDVITSMGYAGYFLIVADFIRFARERFLNPDRVTMPDIAVDFHDDWRDEVIAYVVRKYGQDHLAQIITFGTMLARP